METWVTENTATWLCQIGLSKKYGDICQKEYINGRALLLLAIKSPDKLVSVLQLKKGPETILMDSLEPHLKTFDPYNPRTARNPEKTLSEWSVEKLCSWLTEVGIPEECLNVAKEEEINGHAFLLLRKSGKLKHLLQLKEGPWIILEHELFLHLEKAGNFKSGTSSNFFTGDTKEVEEPKQLLEEFKEPLATSNLSAMSDFEIADKATLSKEKERLSLLHNALKLDIEVSTVSKDSKECLVQSIFVKRGKGANALEALFNFIVITKDEMTADNSRKLWSKLRKKTEDWLKLLPERDSRSFFWDAGSECCEHVPTGEKVSLQDGKVGQIFLEKLSDDEYRKSLFVILVDRQLFQEKKTVTYNFSLDRKHKYSYNVKLNLKESKYHASFDPNSPREDLRWSKHFRSLTGNAGDSSATVLDSRLSESKSSLKRDDVPRYQTPRPFSSEFGGNFYKEGAVFASWETGSKDLIKPAHEFKLLRKAVNNSEDDRIEKFLYETLRFACGCLNERTNGTIHFGVADEVEGQTCGHQPREIVGCWVSSKPRYNEKLTEFIDKCFVGDSRSNVHNCIRPPVFIPVKGTIAELHTDDKVVIEVDIEPSYSLCAQEIFKVGFKCFGRGKEEARAFIRRGSKTQAIVELRDMEDYIKNRLPKLDEERKKREQEFNSMQGLEMQDSIKHLYGKLKRLLCANKKVLDSSLYPILVLSKPDGSMNQDFLDKMFGFIQKIKWQVIIDFDDQASDSSGLCNVYKSGPDAAQCDLHEAEDYDGDDDVIESTDIKSHWIFGNGYAKLGKEAVGLKQWNNSKRKRGLSLVIQSLAKKIPAARAVVLFLLLSKEYETMADTFKDFCTYLDGPNQLVYVAENSETVKDWEEQLSRTCLEEYELRERGVVGMSWREFQVCMLQMVSGIDQCQRYVTMTTGIPYPLKSASFINIEIVSAKECEELRTLSSTERLQISSKVESDFYRGYAVTWRNFWFTDDRKNHVLRRANYSQLKTLIENLHSRGSEGKVHTVTIYHHIGAGASTMTRQALWDFRSNQKFPYRCAVVTKIDDSTCEEILLLRKVGYEDDNKLSSRPPVLALVEDTDDFLFREFRSQVVEQANKLPRTESPVCVFLYCKETQKPYDCHLKEVGTSVYLEQQLSEEEVDWFKDKYTEMKGKFHHKDPESDFETYANENLISFMIMKENFNPNYASSIVERNLNKVTKDELTLLEYTSLLGIYNPYPVFVSCFDSIMLSVSLLRRRIFRDWVEDLTHSARIFLREVDVSTHFGTGKTIAVVHPIIASELLDKIAEKKETTVGQIVLDFLHSPLLEHKGKSFTAAYLYDSANRMLKHRKKYEYGDDVQTKFSPLIEKILYVKDAQVEDGKRQATEKSIDQAAEVLREGLEKFKDPMLAQQMARVFYVNAAVFSETTIGSCFAKAREFCEMAIKMSPNHSCLFDTMGRIYESEIKISFCAIRKENRVIEIEGVTPVLPLAFEAFSWFQKSMAASADVQSNSGLRGELSVMFYLLDVLRCARIFRGKEGLKRLQGYLAYCQVIPPEVQEPWSKFHIGMKDLRNRFCQCMEGLTEDFAVFKGNSLENKMVPKQIASYKAQYHSYFGEGEIKWNTESPEERWEHRWFKINQFLAGGIFSSAFSLYGTEGTPRQTLQQIQKLAYDNYREPIKECYNDLLLIIASGMALHSPYRKLKGSKHPSSQVTEDYNGLYKFVEKLFVMEENDEGHKKLYAHLLKVMFLWPREDLELSNYSVQDFYDSLQKLKERWGRKRKEQFDTDKMLKQKLYKYMSFKRETRMYTTLFYLGKGSGLDVFVHINELTTRGSVDWENPQTKLRLKRLTGVVESKNVIRIKNPLDANRTINIYYSSFREGGFSKEEVSFYLGFSWAQLIACDVKYTNKDHKKHSVDLGDPISDDQLKFVPKYDVQTYEQYTWRLVKLTKRLNKIDALKRKQEQGEELDENQVTNSMIPVFHQD